MALATLAVGTGALEPDVPNEPTPAMLMEAWPLDGHGILVVPPARSVTGALIFTTPLVT